MFMSVWRWNVRTGPVEFRGIDNYTRVLSDPIFQSAIGNTVYYTLIWVPLTMAIGLFLAIIVNQKIRGQTFFRGGLLLPGDRQLGGDHDPVDLHRLAVRAVQQHARGPAVSIRLRHVARVRARTRTGSATRTPR